MRSRDDGESTRQVAPRRAPGRRVLTSGIVLAVSLAACSGGAAAAAGVGYGGLPPVPTAVPGGFRDVVTAVSVTRSGATIAARVAGAKLRIAVPRGAAPRGEQIVVTRARDVAIDSRDFKRVPARFRSATTVFACGIVLDRYGAKVVDSRFVVVRISSPRFRRASDYVVVYSTRDRAFVPAPRGHARVVDGNAVVRVRAGTEIAVIERH